MNNEKAIQLYMSVGLLRYGLPKDEVNQNIMGILCYNIYPCEDVDDPTLEYVATKMADAYKEKTVKKVLGELLLEFEHYLIYKTYSLLCEGGKYTKNE